MSPITPDVAETIDVPFKYWASENYNNGSSCHTATSDSDLSFDYPIKFKINGFFFEGGRPTENIPLLDGKTMPTHTFLPVMIYIGKPS